MTRRHGDLLGEQSLCLCVDFAGGNINEFEGGWVVAEAVVARQLLLKIFRVALEDERFVSLLLFRPPQKPLAKLLLSHENKKLFDIRLRHGIAQHPALFFPLFMSGRGRFTSLTTIINMLHVVEQFFPHMFCSMSQNCL